MATNLLGGFACLLLVALLTSMCFAFLKASKVKWLLDSAQEEEIESTFSFHKANLSSLYVRLL